MPRQARDKHKENSKKDGVSHSYLPWTWNTWGAATRTRNETGSTIAAGLEAAAGARGGGEALVKDYKTGEPTDWGKAVKESFAKATAGVPLV